MLKVVIVDDEIIVRVGFQSCINWEEYGCEVVSTCESARSAIEFFERQEPDLVFTDIMMPDMDGIQLVEHIRAHYPRTKVVVLSCINEIEYVKKAIKLGAEDYILKLSVTRDTMIDLVTRLKETIKEEREKEGGKEKAKELQSFNREDDYRLLLSGTAGLNDCVRLMDRLGYTADAFYCAGCLLIDHLKTAMDGEDSESYTRRSGLLNIIREYFGKSLRFDLAFINESEIMVIFTLNDSERLKDFIPDRLELLNHALKTHLNLTLSMGLGDQFNNRNGIPLSYQQAKKMAHLRFFDGAASFHTGYIEKKALYVTRRKVQRKIQEAVFKQDSQEVSQLTDEWFGGMAASRSFEQIETIRRSVMETWIFVSGYTLKETDDEPEYDDSGYMADFWSAETIWDLKQCFQMALQTILNYFQSNKTVNPEIMSLLHYLETHVDENITLEEAAGRCALGKSQFCLLFKKAAGETFINYFNGLKMKKAFALLSSGNVQVREAADRIGIRDISYFSRLFKRYYNMSPSDLKKL